MQYYVHNDKYQIGVQQLADMKQNFDDEVLTMSGKTLRMIMKKTAHFGVNNYLRYNTSIDL